MSEPAKCLLCHNSTDSMALSEFMVWPRSMKCSRCGIYEVDERFLLDAGYNNAPFPLLSGLARERHERGERLSITNENYEGLQRLAPQTAMEKARKLLQAIARKSPTMGGVVGINPKADYPLAYCSGEAEYQFIFDSLVRFKWIVPAHGGPQCVLMIEGWEEAEKVRPVTSAQGFVAMWFAPDMKPIYDKGFDPGVTTAGYKPFRVDNREHNDKVDDLIIASIRESRFVVADFTGHRGGVDFEAGFALGMGLPVIWSCRDDAIKDLHFDIRQYNCVTWTTADELRVKLNNRIRATIGIGPLVC